MKIIFLIIQFLSYTFSLFALASVDEAKLKLRNISKKIDINERSLNKFNAMIAGNSIWGFSRIDKVSSKTKDGFDFSSRYGIILLKPDKINTIKKTGIYIVFDFPNIDNKDKKYGRQFRKKLESKINSSDFKVHDFCDAVLLGKSSNNNDKKFVESNFKGSKVSIFCNKSSFAGSIVNQTKSSRFPDEVLNLKIKGKYKENQFKTNINYTFITSKADLRFSTTISFFIKGYLNNQKTILENEYAKLSQLINKDQKDKKDAEEKRKIAEKKERELALKKEKKAIEEKERKLAEELAKKKKLAEEKARKRKIAEEKALKRKIALEKEKKRKEAAEKARKKKLAEEELKKKQETEKIVQKIKDYKRKANYFYKDIEEFVKSGGNIDLVKLSDYFDVKPDPKKNWNSSDLKTYENLRQFMSSVSEFVTYEKQKIGERLKKSFVLKEETIGKLEKNLDNLKRLMRKMFGSSDMPKIKKMIKQIETSLANFNQTKANKIISQTTLYINSKLDKPMVAEKTKPQSLKKTNLNINSWSSVKNDFTIQQRQFCQLTDGFFDDLEKARSTKNEIRVNIVHKQRQGDLDALIPGGKITNWIFKVVKIDQVEDGSAAVVLSLQCKSFVGSGQIHTKSTWRSKSNKEWRATIPYNDRRYRELAKLSSGEFVVASGVMLEIGAYKPGQKETFYASQPIGEHPLTKDLNLKGELFVADLSYIAALN